MNNTIPRGRAKDILFDSFEELDYKWIVVPIIAILYHFVLCAAVH